MWSIDPATHGSLSARILRAASASASPSPAPSCWSRNSSCCDEPTSALDMSVQAQIVGSAARSAGPLRGLAYLFISHDLKSGARPGQPCGRHAGRQGGGAGPAAELFAAPQTPYTRALLSAAFDLETAGEGVVRD
jgi:microcin C transport system ATP-binding protein